MRTSRATSLVLVGVLFAGLFWAGCGGSLYFRPHAFVPPLRHYRIRYVDDERRVLPPDWRILNFTRSGHTARAYDEHVEVDEGGGPRQRTVPQFDLLAEHERDGTTLVAATLPLGPAMDRRDLSVLAHDLASGAFGSGLRIVRRRAGAGTEEHLVTTRTIEESPAEVGGAEAYFMSVERVELGGESTWMTFVIVRPHGWRWRHGRLATLDGGAPMVLLFAYVATAARYPLHVADFDALLHRIDVRPPPD